MMRHLEQLRVGCGRIVLTCTLACVLGMALGAHMPAHAQQAWGLGALMQLLSKQKSAKATFTEKKFLALAEQPLESSGELSYTAPGRLEKRTLKPRQETMLLNGDRLSVISGMRRASISIQGHPEAAAFVESIRGTLSGDQSALEKYYKLDLSGHADAWSLVLVPSQPGMLKIISRIRIEGSRSAILLIVFDQADGDRSEMRIVPSPAS